MRQPKRKRVDKSNGIRSDVAQPVGSKDAVDDPAAKSDSTVHKRKRDMSQEGLPKGDGIEKGPDERNVRGPKRRKQDD